MLVTCPDCATSFEAADQAEVVCPACMTAFAPPPPPPPGKLAMLPEEGPRNLDESGVTASQYRARLSGRLWELQTAEGGVIAGLSRYAVREGIYTGKLGNTTKVRRPDGTWEYMGTVQEFAAVFKLLGKEPTPLPATRKIAGWKGEREEAAPLPDLPPAAGSPKAGEATPQKAGQSSLLTLVALGLLLALVAAGVLAGLLYLTRG
jgi:hypothetical protein